MPRTGANSAKDIPLASASEMGLSVSPDPTLNRGSDAVAAAGVRRVP